MGSLTSKPKAPSSQPQVVYVRQPVPEPAPAPALAPSEPSDAAPVESEEESRAKARAASLLRRDRSRFGTVLTGFRGLLGTRADESAPQRKTLLGE